MPADLLSPPINPAGSLRGLVREPRRGAVGLMLGLPGLIIDDGDPRKWPRRPVVLPTGRTAIEIEKLWVRGKPMKLVARRAEPHAEPTPI
jgi:hypothetical protein